METDLLHIWWLVAAMLVFMMQVGFLLLETGLIQERHMAGIAVKSMMMLLASSTAYMLFGHDYMWRNSTSPHVSSGEWTFYQTGFASVSATILSGSMAGRTTLISNVIMAAIVGGVIYPTHARWVWGNGLLATGDFRVHDFAGSGCVHLLGGLVALAGAMVAGPRREKLDIAPGAPMHISPRSLPMTACGVLFLWIGWMGFNGGSIQSADRLNTIGSLVITTCLAASAGGLSVCACAAILRLLRRENYVFAPYSTLSGIMAGMVANSGCCDLIAASNIHRSLVVGAVAGVFAYAANWVIQRVCRVDDPIEAVAVHAGGGLIGLLFAGLYQSPTSIMPQVIDVFVLITIAFFPSLVVFKFMHALSSVRLGGRVPIRLKSTPDEEVLGLIFDDPATRVGQPPVHVHYLPRDLQRELHDSLLLLTSMPLHAARALADAARELIDKLRNSAAQVAGTQRTTELDVKKLDLLLSKLDGAIASSPEILNRLAAGTGVRLRLEPLVSAVIDEYRQRYGSIVSVVCTTLDGTTHIQGDEIMTREAIRMLVSNGVKACIDRLERRGPHYQPAVSVQLAGEPSASRFVRLLVRDNGVGINPEIRHYLGQPFVGLKHSGRGSGIGLFFAAYIIQTFGGRLDCLRGIDKERPGADDYTEFQVLLQADPGGLK